MRVLGRVVLGVALPVAACLPRPQPAQPQVAQTYPQQQPYPQPYPQQPYPQQQPQPYPSPQPYPQPYPQQQPHPYPQPQPTTPPPPFPSPQPQPAPPPFPQPQPQPPPQPQPTILFDARSPPTRTAVVPTAPDGAEIDQEELEPKDWTVSEPVRLMSSLGTSGAPESLEPAIAFGTRNSMRASDMVNVGINTRLVLSNWSETGRFYSYVSDCETIDTRCDKRADYGVIGWMIAFSSAEVGFDVMFRREGPNRAWASVGTTLVLFTDGTGFGEDGGVSFDVGHAGTFGVGYDFEVVGIGLRATAARDWLLFGTTGPALLSAFVSVDVLLPRDHEDRKRTKR